MTGFSQRMLTEISSTPSRPRQGVLIRGLAELHDGRAWLESEPGKGCCAYVVLPLENERASVRRERTTEAA
jgi:hypothetical protein